MKAEKGKEKERNGNLNNTNTKSQSIDDWMTTQKQRILN